MTKAGSNKSTSVLAILTPAGVARALDVPESEGARLIEAMLSGQPAEATGCDRAVALIKAAQDVLDGATIDEVVLRQPRKLSADELDARGVPEPPPAAQGAQLPERAEERGLTAGEAEKKLAFEAGPPFADFDGPPTPIDPGSPRAKKGK